MPIASDGPNIPLFIADYRYGRVLAERGSSLPQNATAAARTGYYIRHDPTAHVAELQQALRALAPHERYILGAACQSTIAQRLPIPADKDGQLARAALVSALAALTD